MLLQATFQGKLAASTCKGLVPFLEGLMPFVGGCALCCLLISILLNMYT